MVNNLCKEFYCECSGINICWNWGGTYAKQECKKEKCYNWNNCNRCIKYNRCKKIKK